MESPEDLEYKRNIQSLQKDVNFILDDICNYYYVDNQYELSLHKKIIADYDRIAAKNLYQTISAKTPYKRIWDIFLLFNELIQGFTKSVNGIKSIDRIRMQNKLSNDLYSSFDEEYCDDTNSCIEIAQKISNLDTFFKYFIPNNDRVLNKIFRQDHFQQLYTNVHKILLHWYRYNDERNNTTNTANTSNTSNTANATTDNTQFYNLIINEIRSIESKNILNIITNWKCLHKRLKHYYPTSIIWYSKKYYFDCIHELIDVLELYHLYTITKDTNLLNPLKKKRFHLKLPNILKSSRTSFIKA